MGNRATVQFIDANDRTGVAVYLHWNGDSVHEWLKAAAPNMRASDSGYAAARFIAYCCEQIPGGLSVGVYRAAFDPGDNGLFVVDCSAGTITRFRQGTNGAGLARCGRPSKIKLGQF